MIIIEITSAIYIVWCFFNYHRNPRAQSTRSQRVGNQAEGAWRVSPAHLPPGCCAVCRPPRHAGSYAGEGCHYGERVQCFPVHRALRQCARVCRPYKKKSQRGETVCTSYVNNVWSHQPKRLILIIILWWPWWITVESAEQPRAVSYTLTPPSFMYRHAHTSFVHMTRGVFSDGW